MEAPLGLSDNQRTTLKLQAIKYVIVSGQLWWRSIKGVPQKCVDKGHLVIILNEMHKGLCGVYYMAKTTAHKVISARFLWYNIFKYAHKFERKCDACQGFSRKLKFSGNLSLNLVDVQAPF